MRKTKIKWEKYSCFFHLHKQTERTKYKNKIFYLFYLFLSSTSTFRCSQIETSIQTNEWITFSFFFLFFLYQFFLGSNKWHFVEHQHQHQLTTMKMHLFNSVDNKEILVLRLSQLKRTVCLWFFDFLTKTQRQFLVLENIWCQIFYIPNSVFHSKF